MILIFDTSTDPEVESYEQTEDLDGREYLIRLDRNERDESWSFSMYLTDGTPLALGKKVVLNYPLMFGETDSRLPPGRIFAVDTTASDTDPGLTELGDRVILVYLDAAEVALLTATA
jgi:hypothetical protein